MRIYEIKTQYFEWLCQKVACPRDALMLMYHLNHRAFNYIYPMDGNRECDGIDLRYTFGRECGYHDSEVATLLDTDPCSILEMMVALSIRCDVHIMWDWDNDNTSKWFWGMVDSLGLTRWKRTLYLSPEDQKNIDYILDNFLSHNYEKNGKGGLFTIHDPNKDMRDVDIWCQLNWYLNEVVEREYA